MPLFLDNPASERATFDIVSQSIGPLTNYTASIPLSRSDYNQGDLVVNIPAAVVGVNALNKRSAAYYKFGTALTDAQGIASEITQYQVSLCVFYDRWPSGFAFRNDDKLSNTTFASSGSGQVQLTSIKINGTAIDMVFRNTHTVYPATLTCYVKADVWKATHS